MSDVPHPYDPDWPEVYLILTTKCAGCHNATSKPSDLSTYEALMAAKTNAGKVVAPGDAEESLLYQFTVWNARNEDDSDLPRRPEMPHDELQWLTAGQQEAISRWIERGALEYQLPKQCKPYPLNELDFPSAKQCASCHPRQYEQWSRSMHAYAQHSPVFEAFNLTLIERTGGTIGTFCTRCHTNVGTALGENGSRRNVHRSRLAMEGMTCVACHRQNRAQYKANARVHLVPGKLLDQCMFGPFDDPVGGDDVGTHPSVGRAYLKTSQFCGECHDVTNPQGVRLEEAFSEWQNSPAAAERITCQQCHMGPIAGVPVPEDERPLGRAARVLGVDPERIPLRRLTDHTFAGPDYSLLPDTEFPYKLDWMYECDYRDEANLTPHQRRTLEELRRRNRAQLRAADEKRYELLRALRDSISSFRSRPAPANCCVFAPTSRACSAATASPPASPPSGRPGSRSLCAIRPDASCSSRATSMKTATFGTITATPCSPAPCRVIAICSTSRTSSSRWLTRGPNARSC
ncbi:MAG: multiheme c-type cytochrome [Pirellulales bacterium]